MTQARGIATKPMRSARGAGTRGGPARGPTARSRRSEQSMAARRAPSFLSDLRSSVVGPTVSDVPRAPAPLADRLARVGSPLVARVRSARSSRSERGDQQGNRFGLREGRARVRLGRAERGSRSAADSQCRCGRAVWHDPRGGLRDGFPSGVGAETPRV